MQRADPGEGKPDQERVELKLLIPADLYRAFQRCLWVQVNETGRTPLELMEEMVANYLKIHGC